MNQISIPGGHRGSAGHVLSHNVVHYLTHHEQELFRYQGEDISIGIWLQEAVDLYGHIPHVTYIRVAKKLIFNTGLTACLDRNALMMGHQLTPLKLYQCYNAADEAPVEKSYVDSDGQFRRYHNQYTQQKQQLMRKHNNKTNSGD